ncbi:alpha/beta hydrolase-fold protein [Flavobacteriaceae bacterium LMO-SS05]
MKSLSAFIISTVFAFSFTTVQSQQVDAGKIIIGTEDSLLSTILNEQRKVWVYVPDSPPNSDTTYPVVYLLDGDGHFPSVVGLIQQLSTINGNTVVPKMIVVGIPNTDRLRDLTPTHANEMFPGDTNPNTSGGGEQFLDFMEQELMPYIESHYPTKPYRLFIGHSLGGLMVVNTLLKRPELFNSYLAIDPSLRWADSALMHESKTLLNSRDFSQKSLFIGIANTLPPNMDTTSVMQDTTAMTQHIRDILSFSNEVVPNSRSGLSFASKYYPNDSHGSVPLIATYDGLRFLFSWFDLDTTVIPLIFNPEGNDTDAISLIEKHYKQVSDKMGFTELPPEDLINQLGYACMQQGLNEKAHAFFSLNVKNFPNHSNVYDSLGDYYAAVEERDQAITAYEKAMSTGGGNSYSQEKLDALKKQH